MKMTWIKTIGLAAMTVMHSHAIFGIGGQWAPSPGLEIAKDSGTLAGTNNNAILLKEKGATGLKGFGLKLWIDALPFLDIEASSNFQFGYYDVDLVSDGVTVPVKAKLDLPFVEGRPVFARIVSDASLLYPFLKLPPMVSLAKLYAGAGITHVMGTEVLNAKFSRKAVTKAVAAGKVSATNPTTTEVSNALIDAIKDEGLASGIGFHLMAGVRVKPPIIPLAVFANVKYHMLGAMPASVDANSLSFELGGGIAF